jgi:prevent-host-death family protein
MLRLISAHAGDVEQLPSLLIIGQTLSILAIRWARSYSRQDHYISRKLMENTVSAADANRQFSRLLHAVRAGGSYIVTSHGKPVAKIVPAGAPARAAAGAHQALLARLEQQPVVDAGSWTRDELYESDAE